MRCGGKKAFVNGLLGLLMLFLPSGKLFSQQAEDSLEAAFLEKYRGIFYEGYYTEDYESSISQLQQGLGEAPKDKPAIQAKIRYFLAFSQEKTGDIVGSQAQYEAAAAAFEAAHDSSWLGPVYGNLAAGYTQQGDYAKAVLYLKKGISLAKELADSTTLWKNHKLLGQAFFYQGDLQKALQQFEEARRLYDPQDGTFAFFEAKLALAKDLLPEAIRAAETSLRQAGQDKAAAAEAKKLLGEIYLQAAQPLKALQSFESLLPFYQKAPNQRELGKLYILIAAAQQELARYDAALKSYQKALKTFLPSFQENDPSQNPDPSFVSREIWLMEIMRGKGQCFLKKFEENHRLSDLHLAAYQLEDAVRCIEEIKLAFDESASMILLGSYTHDFYEDLIEVKYRLAALENKPALLEEAFLIAQKANAFVLREYVSEQQALQLAGVSADTMALLSRHRATTNRLLRQLEQAPSGKIDSLNQLLFQEKQQLFSLKKNLEKAYPLYAALRNELAVAGLNQLQQVLDSSQLLIKYFVGKKRLYIFSIAEAHFQLDTLPISRDFFLQLYRYRRAISELDFVRDSAQVAEQQYLHAAHELYRLLLEKPLTWPGSQGIRRLTIVADDVLHSIPFQALQLRPGTSWTKAENMLISQYAVSYSYFCHMLLDETSAEESQGSFVSFGLEFDDFTLKYLQSLSKDSIKNQLIKDNLRSGSLSKLPFSDDEARALARMMRGTSWLNEQATKANFVSQSQEARLLHLATHSLLDTQHPLQSALIFTKTRDSLDNLLRLDEVYSMKLQADMIVLSACNTAWGQQQKGEGINSLARAFHFAGVPSVTATLWSISDQSSQKLMELYYSFLKAGDPKDIALQKAQLEYLKNDKLSSPAFRLPVYWAAWVSMGENGAVFEVPLSFWEKNKVGLILGFLLILIASGLLAWRRHATQ